jgi:hypothetical protein
MSTTLIFPNFNAEAVQLSILPWMAASMIAKENTAEEHEMKVFQRRSNFQNGFGAESSNINNAPPIGAPNATLTPAEAPAAMNFLF